MRPRLSKENRKFAARMSKYTISEVQGRKALREFVRFPDELYKACPQYVPALHSDQIRSLTTCASAKYCPHKLWLLYDAKGKVAGRICAMINPRYNEYYSLRRARFGWFDVVDDTEAARLLLETAENWAREQGMIDIHGPLYYNTLGKQGMLVEGYENIPPFNCLYNFPYYKDLVEQLGYTKDCDWVQYRVDATSELPQRLIDITERLTSRYGLRSADIDRLKKQQSFVDEFFKEYGESFEKGKVQNFVPFTLEETREEAAQVIPLVGNRFCDIQMGPKGDVAAFGIALPSISRALQKARGSMFPLGWVHFLKALHSNDTLDLLLTGAAPSWQHTGVSAIYHCRMHQKMRSEGVKWAITNPQIETNDAVNVWKDYPHEPFMRRRCYIKTLASS